ncbi:MAG: hypothetical protein OXH38_07990 [Chloroflexi bacterium]|nr:hypothetical protein [Chloroflexota bacterium]
MTLGDVTADGVERAAVEFDRLGREVFLDHYGFGKARSYFLVHGGRRYDSKAVVGVAHGFDRPDLGPLQPQDFSGGEATVAARLRVLGFHVENYSRGIPWAEEERILVLDLYLRAGRLGKADLRVEELCRDLAALTVHSTRPVPYRGRSADTVALKLGNFAWLDPNEEGGASNFAKGDADVWDRYASDEDALAATVAAIKEERRLPAEPPAQTPRTSRVRVEAQHVEQFRFFVPGQDIEATRREQSLVMAYVEHLESQGHKVTRGRYRPDGSDSVLASDLVDETDGVLYEAKGDVRRASVRMAIGQLLDYRRFEPSSMGLAVLLPRQPVQDLIELILTVPAAAVWRTNDGFASVQP